MNAIPALCEDDNFALNATNSNNQFNQNYLTRCLNQILFDKLLSSADVRTKALFLEIFMWMGIGNGTIFKNKYARVA